LRAFEAFAETAIPSLMRLGLITGALAVQCKRALAPVNWIQKLVEVIGFPSLLPPSEEVSNS
jgi:hypothetical protein